MPTKSKATESITRQKSLTKRYLDKRRIGTAIETKEPILVETEREEISYSIPEEIESITEDTYEINGKDRNLESTEVTEPKTPLSQFRIITMVISFHVALFILILGAQRMQLMGDLSAQTLSNSNNFYFEPDSTLANLSRIYNLPKEEPRISIPESPINEITPENGDYLIEFTHSGIILLYRSSKDQLIEIEN